MGHIKEQDKESAGKFKNVMESELQAIIVAMQHC